jgi:prevent-host-death family protein
MMTKMVIMTKKVASLSLNVADAKRRFSELLGRVAYGRTTVMITRRGKPMAKLVPPSEPESTAGLASVGWLDDDDPFFDRVDEIVAARASRRPRVLGTARRKSPR